MENNGTKTLIAYILLKYFKHCDPNITTYQEYQVKYATILENAKKELGIPRNSPKQQLLDLVHENKAKHIMGMNTQEDTFVGGAGCAIYL
jgi:hypothetical protein